MRRSSLMSNWNGSNKTKEHNRKETKKERTIEEKKIERQQQKEQARQKSEERTTAKKIRCQEREDSNAIISDHKNRTIFITIPPQTAFQR